MDRARGRPRATQHGMIRSVSVVRWALAFAVGAIAGSPAGCSRCPDEEARVEPELPPRLRPCTTAASSDCVFDPPLPGDPKSTDFYPGVGDSPEQRLQRWLAQTCELTCARLVPEGRLRSCTPATKRADGVYRATCDVTYDTCRDQRM